MITLRSILQESHDFPSDEGKESHDKESHDMIHLALTVKDRLGADSGDLLYFKGIHISSLTMSCMLYICSLHGILLQKN